MDTMEDVADRINLLFRDYGLDHDVVSVAPSDTIHRSRRLVFLGSYDLEKMKMLTETIQNVFQVFFEIQPPTTQGRLF